MVPASPTPISIWSAMRSRTPSTKRSSRSRRSRSTTSSEPGRSTSPNPTTSACPRPSRCCPTFGAAELLLGHRFDALERGAHAVLVRLTPRPPEYRPIRAQPELVLELERLGHVDAVALGRDHVAPRVEWTTPRQHREREFLTRI